MANTTFQNKPVSQDVRAQAGVIPTTFHSSNKPKSGDAPPSPSIDVRLAPKGGRGRGAATGSGAPAAPAVTGARALSKEALAAAKPEPTPAPPASTTPPVRGASASPAALKPLDAKAAESLIKSTMNDYLVTKKSSDIVDSLTEIYARGCTDADVHATVLKVGLDLLLDKKHDEAVALCSVMTELSSNSPFGSSLTPISNSAVLRSVSDMVSILPDLVLDSPTIEGLLVDFVSQLIAKAGVISPAELPAVMGELVGSDDASKFARSVLSKVAASENSNAKKALQDASEELKKTFGEDAVPEISSESSPTAINGSAENHAQSSDESRAQKGTEASNGDFEDILGQLISQIKKTGSANETLSWIASSVPKEFLENERFVSESVVAVVEARGSQLSDPDDYTLLTRLLQSCPVPDQQEELQAKALAALAQALASQEAVLADVSEKIASKSLISEKAFSSWESFVQDSWKESEEFQNAKKVLDGALKKISSD